MKEKGDAPRETADSGGCDVKERRNGLMSRADVRRSKISFEEPEAVTCEHCGRQLEPLGAQFGGRFRWLAHEPCTCEGVALEEAAKKRAQQLRDEAAMAKRIEASGVKQRYRNATTANPQIAAYLERYPEHGGRGLFIHGGVGSGKTFAATALTRALVYAGYSVRITTTTAMLDAIADTYGRDASSSEGLGKYASLDMLVLDDMGKENGSGWAVNTIFQIVNMRYEALLPIVVTSQYAFPALEKRLGRGGEPDSAAAIVSRLRQTLEPIHLTGPDRRQAG